MLRRAVFLLACLVLVGTGMAHAATAQLGWTASSPATGVTGYRMYYGTTTLTYTANVNCGLTTTCTVGGLTEGSTYYFIVRAYNATNDESADSNEVNAVITVAPPAGSTLVPLLMPQVHNR